MSGRKNAICFLFERERAKSRPPRNALIKIKWKRINAVSSHPPASPIHIPTPENKRFVTVFRKRKQLWNRVVLKMLMMENTHVTLEQKSEILYRHDLKEIIWLIKLYYLAPLFYSSLQLVPLKFFTFIYVSYDSQGDNTGVSRFISYKCFSLSSFQRPHTTPFFRFRFSFAFNAQYRLHLTTTKYRIKYEIQFS